MYKKLLLVLSGWLLISKAFAQDPQFSQFYAAPLYLNPGFAGSTNASRAILNYRNQWPNMDANFITYMGSFDHFFRKYNSGVGVVGFFDKEGVGGFKSYTIAAQYAYELKINKKLTIRPGIQAGFSNRSINSDGLTFTDELENIPGSAEIINRSRSYADVSAGGVLYSKNFWIGVAGHHLNRPLMNFMDGEGNKNLNTKVSVHGGYKLHIATNEFPKVYRTGRNNKSGYNDYERDVSVTPAFNYKHQGPFDQFDAGLYFTYSPVTFGAWYRGIPIGTFNKGSANQDALIFLLGLQIMDLHVGYSYDFTISKLGPSTGGAHEISLVYDFYLGYRNQKRKAPPRYQRRMPCPDF
jgi:type IX secretion system PorP/SprF family membrane protein